MNQQPNNDYESYLRSLRLSLIQKLIILNSPISVLDIGCADGSMWANFPSNVVLDGVDIDEASLVCAAKTGIYRSLTKEVNTNLTNYDLVMCCGVLEHVDEYWDFAEKLGAAKRIIFTVPNGWSFHRMLGVYAGHISEPCEMHDGDYLIGHKRVFSPSVWRDFIIIFANAFGFDHLECGTIGFKPLSSMQMLFMDQAIWSGMTSAAEDLELCGDNNFAGAELYAVLERN